MIVSDGRYKGTQHVDEQKLITRLAASGCLVIWIAPSDTANTMTGARVVILADPAATSAAVARAVTASARTARPPAVGVPAPVQRQVRLDDKAASGAGGFPMVDCLDGCGTDRQAQSVTLRNERPPNTARRSASASAEVSAFDRVAKSPGSHKFASHLTYAFESVNGWLSRCRPAPDSG